MKHIIKRTFIIILPAVSLICAPAGGATYQLFGDNYLDVGNQWNYSSHITYDETGPVNRYTTATISVNGTATIAGIPTKIVQGTEDGETQYSYARIYNNFIMNYATDLGDGVFATFTNNNPEEMYPCWVNSTDNNLLFGTGDYFFEMDYPYLTWTAQVTNRITYINQQVITVPAGTFSCIVVRIDSTYDDSLGFEGTMTDTLHEAPYIGTIKSAVSESFYNPYEEQTYYFIATRELTWTNVTAPPPSIDKDLTSYAFGSSQLSKQFQIWNDGTGTLNYNVLISDGNEYFSVLPESGSSTGSDDKQSHTITVNRENIPFGQIITGSMMISCAEANDSPQYISLSATNNPVLNQFDFGGFSALAFYWMHNDCNLSDDWCNGCDLDLSGEVNYVDLNIFCSYWLSDKNPVGHWAMDDNAANTTVIDSSINENDGTFIDSTNPNTNAHSVTGQVNRALSFDGVDDYVNIADDPNLDMTTKLTVALWMKQAASASNKAFVVKWDYKTQGCWAFQTDNSEADEIKVFTATFLEDGGLGGHGKTTNANLAAGNWYHVAFVYDGDGAVNADRLKIYVDSIEKPLAFVGTIPSVLQNSSASVKIGKFGGTLSRYFNGIIDDVRIFERALLQAEIEELYYE